MRTYELSIQGHCPSKKNSRPIYRKGGKPFLGKSDRLRDYEEHASIQLRAQWKHEPIDHDVLCALRIYYYAAKALGKRPDSTGPEETVWDVLETAGVVTNDVHLVPGNALNGVQVLNALYAEGDASPARMFRAIDRIPVRDRKQQRVEITLVDLEDE